MKIARICSTGLLCIILALLGGAACASSAASKPAAKVLPGSASPQPQTPQPTYASTTLVIPTSSPGLGSFGSTPWIAATAPIITNSSDLTLNQNLSINPPPPGELVAFWKAQSVQLSWEMPPAVRVPHHYQDGILYYKIYRHTEGPQVVFLAQTTQQTYLDRSVVWGTKYYYTVSAIHTGGIESLRAEEVSAP